MIDVKRKKKLQLKLNELLKLKRQDLLLAKGT